MKPSVSKSLECVAGYEDSFRKIMGASWGSGFRVYGRKVAEHKKMARTGNRCAQHAVLGFGVHWGSQRFHAQTDRTEIALWDNMYGLQGNETL